MSNPDRSPTVTFGLYAMACAYKARVGRLKLRERLSLATCALEWVADDREARDAILNFLMTVELYPQAAGETLLEFLDGWVPEVSVRAPGQVLQRIEEERGQYDWQTRKDAGLD